MSKQKEAVRAKLGSSCFTAFFFGGSLRVTAHWRDDMKHGVQDEPIAPDSNVMSIAGHTTDAAGWVERGFSDC